MSDCQRCAALRMIAEDPTLTRDDMVRLARDVNATPPTCGRQSDLLTLADYERIASLPEPTYDPDDPDNPMLDILMPSILNKQAQ